VSSRTPILDGEPPPAKAGSKKWPLLMGGLSGVLIVAMGGYASPPLPWLLFGCLPALYFGVMVHELGHLMAGLAGGVRAARN
jgi:hypothetical protein